MQPTVEELRAVLRAHAAICDTAPELEQLYTSAAGGPRSVLARAAAGVGNRGHYSGVCAALWTQAPVGWDALWVCAVVGLQLVQLGHGTYLEGYLAYPLASVERRDDDGNVVDRWTRGTVAGDLRHAVLDRLAKGVGFPFDLEGLEVPRDPT